MGVLGFFLVVGHRVLDPTNVGWLGQGDPATHYLGWAFFRSGPWTFPLGANPGYGLEVSSGILYSDSLPVLALLFKPLSPLLPPDFQYFGLWILLCFLLQSYFAWRLIGLVTESPWVRLLGSGLFVFSPPMLWRLVGHEALIGHWIVLAALLLVLTPRRESHVGWWAALAAGAALAHMYLLAMVLVLWAAAWASSIAFGRREARLAVAEVLLVGGSVAAALWQAGFFLSDGKQAEGFGYYRMNLLSPLDPDGWSRLLRDLPGKEGDYEGFNFLGLGIWLVVIAAVPAFVALRAQGRARFRREWLFLGVALLLLFACALSNNVGVGNADFRYPFPKVLRPAIGDLTGLVRSSGRMFWPVFYAIVLLAITLVVKGFGARIAVVLLAVALGVQVTDTRPGWSYFRAKVKHAGKAWPQAPLRSAFWEEAARHYRKLRVLPAGTRREDWAALAYYAARHGLVIDAPYLARISPAALERLQHKAQETLELARFDLDTLYVLQDGTAAQVEPRLGAADLLASVDGLWVVAPGWLSAGRAVPSPPEPGPLPADLPVSFARNAAGIVHLDAGWSAPEEWGVWSDAPEVTLQLPVDTPEGRLWFRVKPYLPPGTPPLEVSVSIDGARCTKWRFTEGGRAAWRDVEVPRSAAGARTLVVTLAFSATRSPAAAEASADTRELALGLLALCLERNGCPRL
jgi:hypothetical protein